MKNTLFTFTLIAFNLQIFARGDVQDVHLEVIPSVLHFENNAVDFEILGKDHLRFSSPSRSDLYRSANGKYVTNKSPRLLFKPDSDFILSAKIKVDFREKWDAGDLIIYNDDKHWAKFCFEADFRKQPRVVSVVCNGTADDCNSMVVEGNEIYYKIAGSLHLQKLVLFYSIDGKKWFPIRTFFLNQTDHLRIGFCVQSPVGEGCDAEFSEISYRAEKVFDWWTGE